MCFKYYSLYTNISFISLYNIILIPMFDIRNFRITMKILFELISVELV